MTTETIILSAGIIALFSAIIGGGFRLKDIEIPLLPSQTRVILTLLGFLMCLPFVISLIIADAGIVPTGTILAWKGNQNDPPKGWVVCDSKHHHDNSDVPDLSGKFLKGIETGEDVGNTGGSTTHIHQDVFHTSYNGQDRGDQAGVAGRPIGSPNDIGHTGPGSNMPPYFSVVYIVKVK